MLVETAGAPAVEKRFVVKGHPTFVLMDAQGAVLDRWIGYRTPEDFIATLHDALGDLTTVEAKQARLEARPEVATAVRLARIHESRMEHAAAAQHWRQAQALDPSGSGEYDLKVFQVLASGHRDQAFSAAEVRAAADAVLKSKRATPAQMLALGRDMVSVLHKDDPGAMQPYVQAALAASEGTQDPDQLRQRAGLQRDQALYVRGDKAKALEYHRQSMPEGWMEKPAQLNRFAWWCFENQVNLAEAEELARKGVELEKPGKDRAEILDTVAEICNLRDNCQDAVALIEQAIQDDPKSEYYPKQLERFQKLLAQKK
jgi:tetratricopeptide (TPR) repeat protein